MSFRNSVMGLDQLIMGDVKEGYVIIITGGPGTLKTAFAFTAMNGMLQESKQRGIYLTLEHKADDLLWALKSLRIKPHQNLGIVDLAGFKMRLNQLSGENITGPGIYDILLKTIECHSETQNKGNDKRISFCTIDSLNVILSMLRITQEERRDFVNTFFNILKSKNLISLIIHEECGIEPEEYYVADGIISVGIDRTDKNTPCRYIIIKKMHGIEHKLGQFIIAATGNGIEIVGQKIKT